MQIRIGSGHPPTIIPCEVPPEIRLSNLSRPVHLVAALLLLPTGIAGMVNDDGADEVQGSWTPFVIVTILFLLRFILYGENSSAIVCRRWCNMQRVYLRRRFGFRNESKYQMEAGAGAHQKYQRQG